MMVKLNSTELISIISISVSFVISILTICFSWKEKKHVYYHSERYSEWRDTCDVVSKYTTAVSISKLENYLRRAAAEASKESIGDFYSLTEAYIEAVDLWTFKLLSLYEVQAEKELCQRVQELTKDLHTTVNRINDLKALCSMENLRPDQRGDIGVSLREIGSDLSKSKSALDEIEANLQKITAEKAKKIKP